MQTTYWDNAGKYPSTIAQLQALVPTEGAVGGGVKNKALEKFRKAVNCYYDLYNNGLCNRAREFAATFGIASSRYGNYGSRYGQILYELTEDKMNAIIEAAAEEQGVPLSTQQVLFA